MLRKVLEFPLCGSSWINRRNFYLKRLHRIYLTVKKKNLLISKGDYFMLLVPRATKSLMVIGSQAKKSEFLFSLDNAYWSKQVM